MKEILEYKLLEFDDHPITIMSIISVILIFLVAFLLVRVFSFGIKKALTKKNEEEQGKYYTLLKLIKYFILTIAVVMALEAIGMNITILLAGSAALLVGIGLGLQGIFNDIVSGFVILFEGNIQVGDIIEVDKLVAKVKQIDIRTSKLYTRDGNYIIMPNSKITGNNMMNWSHQNRVSRFKLKVGVAYGSDTALVKRLLEESAKKHSSVVNTPDILVRFDDFGDSALIFELLFWARQSWKVENVKSDIRFAIDKAFRENGVTIPFPQRDLHLKK